MQPARTAAQTAAMRPVDRVLSLTSATIQPAWRPIRRKTVFSRTNAMVRQFIRSAIRDCAVCTTGALCPSSRPAMTTAMTPEAWISSAAMKATKGTTNEIAVSSTGSVISLRSLATMTKTTKPTAAPPSDAMRNSCPTWKASTPTDIAAMAVRSATSAVASLSSDSPSRIVTTLRGSPIRRAMAVAATASGGATTAPMAKDTGQEMPGISACTMTPTPERREHHQADRQQQDRAPVGVEVDERGLDRGGVQQRRQQPEQHHVGLEVDLRDPREVRRPRRRPRSAAAAPGSRDGRPGR